MGSFTRPDGTEVDVPDVEFAQYQAAHPDWTPTGTVNVTPDGGDTPVAVSPNMLSHAGVHAATPAEVGEYQHNRYEEERYSGAGNMIEAALGGAASTITAGFWKPFEEEQKYNPGPSILGKAIGFVPALAAGTGEADLAGAGLEGAADLAEGAGAAGDTAGALNTAARFSAPYWAGKAGVTAERLLPETVMGSKAVARIAKNAVNATTFAVTDELANQVLDSDKEFSGENLASAAMWAALLGGGGSLIGETGGKLGDLFRSRAPGVSRTFDAAEEAAQRAKFPASDLNSFEPSSFSLETTPEGIKTADAIDNHLRDVTKVNDLARELYAQPAVLGSKGISRAELDELIQPSMMAEKGLTNLKTGGEVPQILATQLEATDRLAQTLSKVTDRVPSRFTDPIARDALWKNIGDNVRPGMAPADVAAQHIWAHLTAPMDAASQAAAKPGIFGQLGRGLINRTPLKYLMNPGGGLSLGVGGVMAAEHFLTKGAAGMFGAGLHGAIGIMAARQVSKLLQMTFRNPAVGGIIAGSTSQVLRGSHVLPGTSPAHTEDPRQALRDFADRTRNVTPQQVAAHTVRMLQPVVGAAPASVAHAGEVAAAKHQYILNMLDRHDPMPVTPSMMLNRPLPKAAGAHAVADALRGLSSPVNAVAAGLVGRLSPELLRASNAVYPATNGRAQSHLLRNLALNTRAISPAHRRSIETLIGPQALGGPSGSAAYRAAMQESVGRSGTQQQGQSPPSGAPKAPPGPITSSPYATSAEKAAHPAEGH